MAQTSPSSPRARRSTSSTTSGGNKARKAAGSSKSTTGGSSTASSSSGPITNLPQLIEQFGSEDRCHAYLEALRWPNGVECPRCESTKISRIRERRQFECSGCRYQFSVRVGTIFSESKLPLWKWFLATYLMVESKKGISANQVKRMLGVSYKTAWYLCHRIRAAMRDENPEYLEGTVEVDETFVGGKRRGTGTKRGMENKTMVLGAVERGGEVRMRIGQSRDGKSLGDFIADHVAKDAPNIYTDDFAGYNAAGIQDADTRHATVNHSKDEWVRGDVHTNTVESVWSLMKRSIVGSYHQLSVKHLPAYLDEMAFRFNNRDNRHLFRDTLRELVTSDPLRYQALVAD